MDARDDDTVTGNDQLPPYLRIADVLRGEITDGVFRVGERIPSQAELEERFQVSRPTVQRALQELRKGGYIDNQRGRAAEVLDWDAQNAVLPAAGEPERAFEALTTYVSAAFEEPEVTIDAYSLTSETLGGALASPLQSVMTGELNPTAIRVRLLLPSQDVTLALPRLVEDFTDDRPLRRLRQLARAHSIALRSSFTRLTDVRPDIVNSIEFRTVPVTPLQKIYILNGRVSLWGYYKVVQRPLTFSDGWQGDIYDTLGVNSTLYMSRSDPANPATNDARFVAESQEWFDALWDTIAEPVTIFE
ncbi:GntR family transcriptional regulator [Streptomyces sp. NBC_01476]|uniref:GntR family transcriptional regulator n=1 Tax=Streptomyces sp. NBC_01476 TaxID=2903881 RepID=UPI002E36B5EF|nr:GntR family transcriptional regulator [Streptomyces sp. NBC_01476]